MKKASLYLTGVFALSIVIIIITALQGSDFLGKAFIALLFVALLIAAFLFSTPLLTLVTLVLSIAIIVGLIFLGFKKGWRIHKIILLVMYGLFSFGLLIIGVGATFAKDDYDVIKQHLEQEKVDYLAEAQDLIENKHLNTKEVEFKLIESNSERVSSNWMVDLLDSTIQTHHVYEVKFEDPEGKVVSGTVHYYLRVEAEITEDKEVKNVDLVFYNLELDAYYEDGTKLEQDQGFVYKLF